MKLSINDTCVTIPFGRKAILVYALAILCFFWIFILATGLSPRIYCFFFGLEGARSRLLCSHQMSDLERGAYLKYLDNCVGQYDMDSGVSFDARTFVFRDEWIVAGNDVDTTDGAEVLSDASADKRDDFYRVLDEMSALAGGSSFVFPTINGPCTISDEDESMFHLVRVYAYSHNMEKIRKLARTHSTFVLEFDQSFNPRFWLDEVGSGVWDWREGKTVFGNCAENQDHVLGDK